MFGEIGGRKHQIFKQYSYGGIGQLAIPIPVAGVIIGGFVGAALSEAFFNALNSKKVELARQRRIEIEKECRFFNESFDELERALYAGDADLAIGSNNKIQEGLGQKPLFNNTQEFLCLMDNGGKIEI